MGGGKLAALGEHTGTLSCTTSYLTMYLTSEVANPPGVIGIDQTLMELTDIVPGEQVACGTSQRRARLCAHELLTRRAIARSRVTRANWKPKAVAFVVRHAIGLDVADASRLHSPVSW